MRKKDLSLLRKQQSLKPEVVKKKNVGTVQPATREWETTRRAERITVEEITAPVLFCNRKSESLNNMLHKLVKSAAKKEQIHLKI